MKGTKNGEMNWRTFCKIVWEFYSAPRPTILISGLLGFNCCGAGRVFKEGTDVGIPVNILYFSQKSGM